MATLIQIDQVESIEAGEIIQIGSGDHINYCLRLIITNIDGESTELFLASEYKNVLSWQTPDNNSEQPL